MTRIQTMRDLPHCATSQYYLRDEIYNRASYLRQELSIQEQLANKHGRPKPECCLPDTLAWRMTVTKYGDVLWRLCRLVAYQQTPAFHDAMVFDFLDEVHMTVPMALLDFHADPPGGGGTRYAVLNKYLEQAKQASQREAEVRAACKRADDAAYARRAAQYQRSVARGVRKALREAGVVQKPSKPPRKRKKS